MKQELQCSGEFKILKLVFSAASSHEGLGILHYLDVKPPKKNRNVE